MAEIIKRDENHATIGAGVDPDNTSNVLMLRVDPATDYLLAGISETSSSSGNAQQIAKRDQNHRTVCMGWDEDNQCLQEILTDADGNILCDLLVI